MQAAERRAEILEVLRGTKGAVSATQLAARFGVSRQVIVGDVALLRAEGADPFTRTSYPVTDHAAAIKAQFADVGEGETGKIVAIAGRLMSKRIMGKASFAELRDGSGDIQIDKPVLGNLQ